MNQTSKRLRQIVFRRCEIALQPCPGCFVGGRVAGATTFDGDAGKERYGRFHECPEFDRRVHDPISEERYEALLRGSYSKCDTIGRVVPCVVMQVDETFGGRVDDARQFAERARAAGTRRRLD